jgi:outer membrane protein OmpA-like peptidoglycan-associated protein
MMDAILGMVTPEMKQALASRLGEAPAAVQGGLGTATAATLGGLANKAGDSGFLSQITGLLGGGTGQSLLGSLSSIASGGPTGATSELINKFLPMVFGSQQNQVVNAISQQAGLSSASGLGLLKMAVPLVLAYLTKLHNAGSLTSASLGSMLRTEAPQLQSYLPSGLLSSASNTLGSAASRAETVVRSGVATATPRPRWLVPAAVLGALLLAWLVIRSMSPRQPVQTAANVTNQVANTATNAMSSAANTATSAWAALGDMMKVKLPDGQEISVPQLGVENKLVTYLNGNPTNGGDKTWFEFDRLLFDTGQASLQPASQEQLGNIAAILKAYPQVKVKIGGYTDNTGDPAANQQLSQQRADTVMAQLVTLGVDPSRMSSQGYGQDNPVADNSTDEGRQKNRRIALEVVQVTAT